ncbi:hypothetical protein Kpol_1035p40, partial [Vanderwaltozyma polyspora DSM 70294]
EGKDLLVADTLKLARDKVEAVLRLDNAMTYSFRINNEVNNYVFQLIKEQIENNKIFISHSLSAPIDNTPLSNFPDQRSVQSSTSSVPTLTNRNILNLIQAESRNNSNLPSPLPQRPPVMFSDTYMNADVIPNSSMSSIPKSESESEILIPQPKMGRISREGGPQEIPDALSATFGEQEIADIGSNLRHESDPSSSSNTPITSSFNNRLLGNASSHSLVVPKLKTSIMLTPRRGSPLLNSSSSSTSNTTALNQPTRSSSGSKLNIERARSPFNSPFTIARDFLTPEQSSNVSNLPKQPLSPLLLATNTAKSPNPSIRDYNVIKPISKGAYGSVYLARKKLTGDYVAIKVLKKSDMIAKNQVTNIKSERAIMMVQSEKSYVARLYESFQNKDNLFLVMEYLPGGDLATVIKMMGYLPDKWAKQYISEVIIGVEDMHKNGIIHHDLKPDNLLIGRDGHLKLTDFGLSRAGLVQRHQNVPSKSKQTSLVAPLTQSNAGSSILQGNNSDSEKASAGTLAELNIRERERSDSVSSSLSNNESIIRRNNSIGSFTLLDLTRSETPTTSIITRPRASSTLSESFDINSVTDYALFHPDDSKQKKKFFGTPDYLAPETIKGTGEDNQCDWWSVGCILFELYFGYPPFHANTPEAVFENILSHNIAWPSFSSPEEEKEYISVEAKDLVTKLLVSDPALRLGANGASEIKEHPYFKDVDWDHVYDEKASFVPSVGHPEDTDYFELRGAVLEDLGEDSDDGREDPSGDMFVSTATPKSLLADDLMRKVINSQMSTPYNSSGSRTPLNKLSISSVLESDSQKNSDQGSPTLKQVPSAIPPHMRERRYSKLNDPQAEFGSFNFRNLSALDKANKDAISRLKNEHLSDHPGVHRRTSSSSLPSSSSEGSVSKLRTAKAPSVSSPNNMHKPRSSIVSETGSIRSISPDRSLNITYDIDSRKNSVDDTDPNLSPLMVNIPPQNDSFSIKQKSHLSPMGTNSQLMGSPQLGKARCLSKSSQRTNSTELSSEDSQRLHAISKVNSVRNRRRSARKNSTEADEMKYHMDILLCEPIPIHRYCTTSGLESLGCTVVAVGAGDELVRRATSGVKFDLIITALRIPKLGAVDIVKLLKHTNGINSTTPIVAATCYFEEASNTNVFSDVLEKPISIQTLRKLISKYALIKSQRQEESIQSDNDTS